MADVKDVISHWEDIIPQNLPKSMKLSNVDLEGFDLESSKGHTAMDRQPEIVLIYCGLDQDPLVLA